MALIASTRCPPKSWAACSRCSLELRSDSSASRICGCFSGGTGAGAGLAAGAGLGAGFGFAAPDGKANVNTRAAAGKRLAIVLEVFMGRYLLLVDCIQFLRL